MPRRRYNRRPRRRRKRNALWSGANKATKALSLAVGAARSVRYLSGLVNSEMFSHDVNGTSSTITDSGTIAPLIDISQGDNEFTRTGNSIFVRSVFGRFNFAIHSSAIYSTIRMIFFQDTQQVGDTAPAVTDVLQTASYLSPLNNDTKGRFKILKDMTIRLDEAANQVANRKVYLPMRHHVRYNGSSSGDIQRGGLYYLVITNSTVNQPTYSWYVRTSYHDN